MIFATTLTGAVLLLLPSPTVELPSIDVAAPIVSVGLDQGELEVPRNVDEVGRWRYSEPGENVVLAAHVSLRSQGRGVFYRLKDMRAGDTITYFGRPYVVESVDTVLKGELDMDFIFRGSGHLVLVTCGGAFSGTSFESNVVVIATPEEG